MGLSLIASLYMMYSAVYTLVFMRDRITFGVFGSVLVMLVACSGVYFGVAATYFIGVDLLCFLPLFALTRFFNTTVEMTIEEVQANDKAKAKAVVKPEAKTEAKTEAKINATIQNLGYDDDAEAKADA
jgi:hypothetical protein